MMEKQRNTRTEQSRSIPQLRFPEFKGEWKNENGEKVFTSISNKDHNSDLPILAITQEYGAIPRNLIDYNISVTDKSIESYKVVNEGDFIISLRTFQGGIEYSNYKGICSPAYIILRSVIKVDKSFFKYYFKTDRYIKSLNKKLEGIRDGKMISFKYFSEATLTYPTLPEQTRISQFFAAIDQKISQLKQKKNLLEHYKKGVMQKIFSQEIRFKDEYGSEFSDWEEKKLDDFTYLLHGDGNWILSKDLSNDGLYSIIQLGNIGFGNYVEKPLKTISSSTFNEIKGTLIKKGDLLISRLVDDNLNCCIFNKEGNFITSVDVCWIRENDFFINYFLMLN